jgi:hypothetical protein
MRNQLVPKFKTKQERIAFWYPICQARLTSNLTNDKFCAKYKVSRSPLQKWIKYFEKHPYISQPSSKVNSTIVTTTKTISGKNRNKNSVFLPVAVTNTTQPQTKILAKQPNNFTTIKSENVPPMELLFPNGVKLILKQEVNINLLIQLITVGGY